MDSLESVGTLLKEYLDIVPKNRMLDYTTHMGISEDYGERVYDCLFNWVTNPKHSPDSIIHLLDTYIRGLPEFSKNIPIQTLVAFPCVEALAKRRPAVLEGPWEKVAWIIIKYARCSNTILGNRVIRNKTLNEETLNWIVQYSNPELCPNPCLRIELFRLMRSFNCDESNRFKCDRMSLRDKVLNTIFQLSNNYSLFTLDQLPNFSPLDLQFVMKDNNISLGDIMYYSDLYQKRHDIIMALFMLTRNLALLEKKRQQRLDNQAITINAWNASLKSQLSCCLSFCGLLPYQCNFLLEVKFNKDFEYIQCLDHMVKAIGNDPWLLDNLILTLDTITEVCHCFPDEIIYMILSIMKKHLEEIYGGLNTAAEYRLRYFQDNAIKPYNDSENDYGGFKNQSDFESNSSDDNHSGLETDYSESDETDSDVSD